MLNRLVQFALSQRLFVLLATALLAGFGWYAFRNLPIDAFPDVSSTQVKVIMKAPGMTPEEIESRIAGPIEVEMLGIPRQRMLRSVSKYGLVDVTVDFEDGTDIYWARQQVSERLANIAGDLPSGISGGMAPVTTPLGEMYMFTIEADGMTLEERRTLLDWVIRPALRAVPGVADVNALGGKVHSFEVVPDPVKLAALGVSTAQLKSAIEANNRNDGAGRLGEGGEVLLVRSEGNIKTAEDLRSIVVSRKDGNLARLGDVAQVRDGSVTRYGVVTKDGKAEAVEGLVLGLAGANAQKVVEGVTQKLEDLKPTLPAGVEIKPFYNRAELVKKAVGTVSTALIEATVIVLVLLGAFLGNVRAAVAVAVILPLSALSTFILMRSVGMSANLMSLGGLAIALGMLVDAAVVVVENIVQHLEQEGSKKKLPRLHIVLRAVREVSVPVSAGILIIITVFLPLLTLQGLEGKYFVPVAMTIVFALISSLVLSLTVIPVLASFLLKKVAHEDPWLPRKLLKVYEPVLAWALKKQRIVFVAAALLLVAAAGIYTQVGKTFLPEMDEGDIIVGIEKLPSVSLEETAALDLKIHQALMSQIPEITGVVARAGSDEIGLDPMGLNQTDTFLVLKPREEWKLANKEALIARIREVLDQMPGISYSFTQPIDMRVSEMIIGVRGDLAIKIFGTELGKLNELAAQIETLMKTVPGNQDVYTVENDGVQYLRVVVDRLSAGRYGLSVEDVQDALRAQIEGQRAGTVIDGNRRIPIVLRGPDSVKISPAEFAALRITTSDGQSVPLETLATLTRESGPVKIDREMGSRYSVVIANVTGRDLVGFVEEARAKIAAEVKLPTGYRISWGGQFENQQRAAARLTLVVPLAIGFIFLILFTTFGSVRQALLVLSNIPFALVGGIVGLWVTGEYLSVPASVGFIALLGIAVLNGVVLVSYFNQLRAEGHDLVTCVTQGARRRLRPVLMTAAITAFSLVPLLFTSGPGSEIQRPLAIVVIGGLITATALTLILLPLLYLRFAYPRSEHEEGDRKNDPEPEVSHV
ncbi:MULTISPECIES: CusA/CzcA family heavy metal efflux RND transporter [unclassified Acidovorax]|jgi:cobalt-zinc-cadmium resistance protein CzcA|uniref:efflux RND transporter permease subunit n=1 Tax=unclassified Acidovorax TaxID=2684926 RepID=UPI000BC7FC69|nr:MULTISPECIES: CusA/CzcA family heavy metal efflux RND transporter [unclassified Acidovorax]OYX12907.1 MAG: CusA/CzcA family heavy metal efflux RND transporter [Acidovorax sp. 32-64-7]OZA58521.1 MAG: CusA/CzcA family heavy metal efflux RND transporter [Acidovorax sp. 17-64-282]HQT51113.1 CusA/CzcA family heavy metal efflux RND transporter [Acidovorax defluvii]MBW8462086.1 CusA/CzcA family heavy metal efflux RND transporter [Acidovorax sp.]OYY26519.1 MAG: CusA/CzcA family heavy metal efflux R